MHKTTLNLDTSIFLRLRNRAATEGTTVSDLVNRLLLAAMEQGPEGMEFSSHRAGEADVDDLGAGGEKYLSEGLG